MMDRGVVVEVYGHDSCSKVSSRIVSVMAVCWSKVFECRASSLLPSVYQHIVTHRKRGEASR